jgi:Domain of unknown function (DUF4349)
MMRRIVLATGAAALGMVLLAGCSQSGSGKASGGGGADTAQSRAASAGGGASAAKGGGDRAAVPAGPAAKVKVAPVTSEALIRTADLVVAIAHGPDVAARANRAGQIATAAGGSVYADERTSGDKPTAALTLKVPGSSLRGVLDQLAALGTEVSRHSSTQDVTGEVADVDSRVRSAQTSIDQWRLLLGRATKIGDIIALESQLSQREADLEALQAQQRSLASRTAMATVTLNLTTSSPAAVVHKKDQDKAGFLGGLERGWRAFTHGAGAVATAVGAALPFLVLGLLLLGAGVLLRRRLRPAAPPAAS